jgi:outer membrane protein assembly factor BamB
VGFRRASIARWQAVDLPGAGDGTTVVAFDKDTGKEIWRALTAKEPGYSSPMICEAGGKRQLIIFHPEAVNALNPETGEVYWSEPYKARSGMTLATPRQLGDELFVTTFYNGSLMLRLDPAKPAAKPIWRTEKESEKNTTQLNAVMCTPFLEDGHIYGVCSYGQLRCLKADTGERLWETFQATTGGEPVRWANAFIVKNGNRFFFSTRSDLIIARLSRAVTRSRPRPSARTHRQAAVRPFCGRIRRLPIVVRQE